MYGFHGADYEKSIDDLFLSIKQEDGKLKYHREIGDDSIDKKLLNSDSKLIINPIEPLNLPKNITSNLLIEFDNPIIIPPKKKDKIYSTFPIEIGVFIKGSKDNSPLDIFSLSKSKYTLYGDIKTGSICKYWKSSSYDDIPDVDPIREGILSLNLYNSYSDHVEIHKVVFSAYGMKIYYDENAVSMVSKMIIKSENISETNFINSGIYKNMNKSLEIYEQRLSPQIKGERFIMEGGL
ncbi:MAG: DUF432 domain-containing protein [Thermoplasmata archaeon]